MKFLKKSAFALLTVCVFVLCAVFLAANVSAAEVVDSGGCGENVTWTLYDDGELVISGEGEMMNYGFYRSVPWYSQRSSIRTVTIENGVTTIGDYAFYDCSSLTSITIPNGVTSIGRSAFYQCTSLASINIPDGVTSIGDSAFSSCEGLTSINIPDGVTSVGNAAFYQCTSLTSITIPDSVTSIGDSAFLGCTSLTKVTVLSRDATFGRRVFSSAPVNLYGYSRSTTEAYASAVGFTFVALDGPTFLLGDISGDGTVDIKDALRLFQYSMNQTDYAIDYTGNVDYDHDGSVDISDALRLFQYSMDHNAYPIE